MCRLSLLHIFLLEWLRLFHWEKQLTNAHPKNYLASIIFLRNSHVNWFFLMNSSDMGLKVGLWVCKIPTTTYNIFRLESISIPLKEFWERELKLVHRRTGVALCVYWTFIDIPKFSHIILCAIRLCTELETRNTTWQSPPELYPETLKPGCSRKALEEAWYHGVSNQSSRLLARRLE